MGVHEEKGQVQEGIGLGAFKGFVTFEKNLGFSIYFSIKLSAYLLWIKVCLILNKKFNFMPKYGKRKNNYIENNLDFTLYVYLFANGEIIW